ncbi:MAG: carboxypeptidase regulatory-like domain-containing protein, partial [Actinomycetes bacterium]
MVPVTAAQAQPTGSISGTVTDQGNAGLGAICVDAYDYRTDAYQSSTSAADGRYTVSGLPVGSYQVEFRDCGTAGTGYQPAVWGSVDGYSGTPVVLDTETSAVTGIDVQLALGGAIAGTVAGVGNVVGACVQAVPYPGYPNSNAAWSGTVIASDGSFRLRGLPAEPLHLKVEDCEETPSFATTWFQNLPEGGNAAPAQADAGPITVTVGQVAQLPQLEVTQPGSISGAVIDSATGEPVVGACVSAHSPNETPTSWGGTEDGYEAERARTDGDGLYRLQGLAEGPWAIMVEPCGAANFERTWLHGKAGLRTADLITVIAGQNTQIYGIGVENGGIPTVSGGSLSGTITAPDGVTPVERACVNALPAGSAPDAWGGEVAWTQADGTYTLQGLAEGTYDITIDNCPRYGWGSDWERPEYLPVSIPDTVTITSANEARILDASFEEVGGKLTGRAVDDQGNPVSGVYVDVYGETTGRNGGVDVTGADGTFRLVGLPQGSYNVSFSPSPRSYALRQQSGPHEVPVNSDGSLGEVAVGDVALSIGGRFTAHVVDSAGEPVTGLELELTPTGGGDPVPAWLDHIPGDYQGHYRPTTVPVGDYTLSFLQCNYVDEVNPCPSVGNQPVSVSRATTTDLETLQLGVLRTRTTLTSSPNPSVDGEEVVLTATVTGPEGANVPTGSIEFSLGDLWFSPV